MTLDQLDDMEQSPQQRSRRSRYGIGGSGGAGALWWLCHVYEAPGYYDNALSWAGIVKKISSKMAGWEVGLLLLSAVALCYAFMPESWYQAIKRQLHRPRTSVPQAVSELSELDVGILKVIYDLEQVGRSMHNRSVWDKLTDVKTSFIDDRLIHLEKTGYITATVTLLPYISLPQDKRIDIHGLTVKGRRVVT